MPNKTVNMVDVPSQGNVPVLYIDNGDGTFSQATTDSSSAVIGAQADAAASTDTGTFSLMAFIKRNLQRWTALFAVLPISLGLGTMAQSFRVVFASDQQVMTTITGAAAQTATSSTNIVDPGGVNGTDVSAARSISIHIVPTGTVSSGVVTFEQSIDGTVWTPVFLNNSTLGTGFASSTFTPTTGNGAVLTGAVNTRFFRARISTAIGGGGTIQALTNLSPMPYVTPVNWNQIAGSSVSSGNGAVGNGVQRVTVASDSTGQTSITSAVGSNGTSNYRNISLLATGQLIKSTSGRVHYIYIKNTSAGVRQVKFYNKATTAGTVGTDTPVKTVTLSAGETYTMESGLGMWFSLGISVGATQLIADSDTTAPAANDINIFVRFI